MSRPRLICIFAVMAMLLFTVSSFGQSESATITGRIADQTGAVVPGAVVRLQSAERGTVQETTTNESGIYVFAFVRPGVYHITIRKQGFKQVDFVGLTANTQAHIDQNFTLQVGAISESVTVSAEVIKADTISAVATVVDQRFVENMPLNGRSFLSLLAITPGVTRTGGAGQFSFNGQRDSTNYFTVDGVAANTGISTSQGAGLGQSGGGQLAATTAIGTTSSLLSVDAMQEFKVQSSTYSAEFGRTPGGQVQITSRSGTNEYHGTAFNYLRNDLFDAMNPYTKFQNKTASVKAAKPPLRQNDFGGVFGGPVRIPGLYNGKDKTFFFFAYEGIRLRKPVSGIFPVAPEAVRTDPNFVYGPLQAYMKLQPLPNGTNQYGQPAYIASFSNPSSTNSTSIRLDHSFGQKLTLFGRYSTAPSYSATRYPSSANQVDYTRLENQTFTLGASSLITNRIANELRFNWTRNAGSTRSELDSFGGAEVPSQAMFDQMFPKSLGATPQNSMFIFGAYQPTYSAAWQVGTAVANTSRQINLVDNVSWAVGRHGFKFGADWRFLYPIAAPKQYSANVAYYSPTDLKNGIVTVGQAGSNDRVVVHLHNLSFYAQDSWRVGSRWTLDYGLRWDYNPAPSGSNDQALYAVNPVTDPKVAVLGSANSLYAATKTAFAPRVGVAYQLRTAAGWETVLKGGYGIFYDTGLGGALDATAYYPHSRYHALFGTDWLAQPLPEPPAVNMQAPYNSQTILGYAPGLTLPRTHQWNFRVEQSLGGEQILSAAYVGSAGRDLLRQSQYGGNCCSNRFLNLVLYSSVDYSDYHALEINYMRRLSHGLQAIANYTWSKSLDTQSFDTGSSNAASSNMALGPIASAVPLSGERGLSSFDARNKFNMSISYDIPGLARNIKPVYAVFSGWSVDSIFTARSGYPLTVTMSRVLPSAATSAFRPDLVPGVPIWISDTTAFGGKRLNPDAFSYAFAQVPNGRLQGNEQRGAVLGFAISQLDLTLRRQFNLSERVKLQWRADMFNALNHTNYANPNLTLGSLNSSGVFTRSSTFGLIQNILGGSNLGGGFYGIGSPRSMQFALKLQF